MVDQPENTNQRQECFASLDKVFPFGDDGMREVAASCWDCSERVECLRAAVSGDRANQGQGRLDEEKAVQADGDGVGGFLRRWSRRKSRHAQRKGK